MTTHAGDIVLALLLSGPAPSSTPAHWHDDDAQLKRAVAHHDREDPNATATGCPLSSHDLAIVAQYYSERARPAPAGLSPKLQRGSRLPAGWEQRIEALPVTVDRQLSALPHGTRRSVLDGYLVIYDPEAATIVDAAPLFRLH